MTGFDRVILVLLTLLVLCFVAGTAFFIWWGVTQGMNR